MNSEPTPTDINAVNDFLGGTPAPAPQPTQPPVQPVAQPAQPTGEPAPAPTPPADPFASFGQPSVTPPTPPTNEPPVTPPAPAEPTQTPPADPSAPNPANPTPATPTAPVEQTITFEDYMKSIAGEEPAPLEAPDFTKVNGEDEAAVGNFFKDLMEKASEAAYNRMKREQNIQTAERNAWEAAFAVYPTLRTNQQVRDLVHQIRMGSFQRGIAITPTQAAQELLKTIGANYQKGVDDSKVNTHIENVQPVGSVNPAIATAPVSAETVTAVQNGNEDALAAYLDGQIKAGKL